MAGGAHDAHMQAELCRLRDKNAALRTRPRSPETGAGLVVVGGGGGVAATEEAQRDIWRLRNELAMERSQRQQL